MKLALAEMARNRTRFLTVIGAVTLIVFLALVLAALGDGLYYGASGAIRTSSADLYVFSKDGREDLTRSSLPAADGARIAAVPGVAEVGAVGSLQGTARGPHGLFDLALFGTVPDRPGGPTHVLSGRLPRAGETGTAAADQTLRRQGFSLGDRVMVSGSSVPITIVGFTDDSRYELQPTLWTTVATWQSVRAQARPEFAGQSQAVQAFTVALSPGAAAAPTAARIDAAMGGQTQTITRDAAVLALPGLALQRSTLNQIVYTTFGVAAVVIGLFFALITLEKRTQLAILKALGASTRYLASGIVVQSLAVCAVGVVLGIAGSRLLAALVPATVPVTFRSTTAVVVVLATFVTGVVGAAFSFRRVTHIDPASALGGA